MKKISDREVRFNVYVAELFDTALEVTEYVRKVHQVIGARPPAWKAPTGRGKYYVEHYITDHGYAFGKDAVISVTMGLALRHETKRTS